MTAPLSTLQAAARAAGEILVAAFASLDSLHVRNKGPADFVSEADLDAEQVIRKILEDAVPDAAWRGEESEPSKGASAAGLITGMNPAQNIRPHRQLRIVKSEL
ncbi:MAG: hypothetical protein R6X02_03700 [Enhygromyxa sp.]